MSANSNQQKIVLGISGASGSIYAKRALEVLTSLGFHVHLICSPVAKQIWQEELQDGGLKQFIESLPKKQQQLIELENVANLGGGPASGSYRHRGMLVLPCSVKCLAAIANGFSSNLLERSADVCLKERRPLVLCVRETPLSKIHIENMLRATEAGAVILPASPAFYHGDTSVQGLVDFVLGKALDQLGIDAELFKRWKEGENN